MHKTLTKTLNIDSEEVRQIVAIIVATVHPLRVLIFGSVGRGTAGEYSDVDLLVVLPTGTHRRKAAQEIQLALFDCGVSSDVLVATEQDIADYGDNEYLYLKHALHEGKEVYRAA